MKYLESLLPSVAPRGSEVAAFIQDSSSMNRETAAPSVPAHHGLSNTHTSASLAF